MSLNVRIITPEKVFLTSETEQVVLPSITGGLGILAGHAPLVTILEAGVLRYKNNGSWTPTVLYGGFAEVENNQVTQKKSAPLIRIRSFPYTKPFFRF